MIERILIIPEYLNVEEIKNRSLFMNNYLHENILEALRKLYVNDIEKFNLVLKELYFRGIGFNENYQNNFLKDINFEITHIIKVEVNNDSFSKIDFKYYGLGNFIEDYKIRDDKFFNGIPLNGLYSFIPSFKRTLFRKNIEKLGFHIIKVSNNEKEKNIEMESEKITNRIFRRKIKDYLDNKYFNHFLNYCNERSIDYLEDINEKVLNEYRGHKGTREVTYGRVLGKLENLEVCINYNSGRSQTVFNNNFFQFLESTGQSYLEFLEDYFTEENLLKKNPYKEMAEKYEQELIVISDDQEKLFVKRQEYRDSLFSHDVYSDIKDIPVSVFLTKYSEYNIFLDESKRIAELSMTGIDHLITKKILKIIEKEISIEDFINTFHSTLNENESEVLKLRSNGETLQFTGEEIGVTRERVRQIEVKLVKKFQENRSYEFFIDLLDLYLMNYCYIDKDYFLVKGINTEIYNEIIYLIGKSSKYKLLNKDTYLLDTAKFIYLEEIMERLSLEDVVISKEIFRNYRERERDILTYLLSEKGYVLFEDKYIKEKITIIDRLEYLFKKKIKGPLKNNDDSYVYLKNLLKKIFNYTVESNRRSLFTRVSDTKNVVLVDRNTYMYEDFTNIDSHFLNELKMSIDDELNKLPYADPRKLYQDQESLMKNNEILSYSHLYSVIKKFFSEEYNIGYQNTLYIYKNDSRGKSAEEIILEYVDDLSVISFDELINSLGWKVYKLEQLISRLDYLVINSKKEIINITNIEKEMQYDELLQEIENELNKGYMFTMDFLYQLYSKEILYKILQKYNLTDSQAFAGFVKKRFEKVKGYWQFLYISGHNIEGVETILPNHFETIVPKKEVSDFLYNRGYAQATVYLIMDDLIDLDLFIPFEKDYLRNMKKDPLSNESIEEINLMLEKALQKYEVVTEKQLWNLTEINEIRDINSTPQLLTFIADHLGFTVIEAYDGSKYEIPIILSKESSFKEYDELIHHIISSSFKLGFSTRELLKFLKKEYLVSQNASGIYHKIKGSKLFEFDNSGAFKLLGADNNA